MNGHQFNVAIQDILAAMVGGKWAGVVVMIEALPRGEKDIDRLMAYVASMVGKARAFEFLGCYEDEKLRRAGWVGPTFQVENFMHEEGNNGDEIHKVD